MELFRQKLKAINLGNRDFAEDLRAQGTEVYHLEWEPPARGKKELIDILNLIEDDPEIEKANKIALEKYFNSQPVLVSIGIAREVIPGMDEDTLLHAGPPITWEKMSGPLRGAVIGALIYEGRANTPEEAEKLAKSGKIKFSPCHEHNAVGPMAGVISPSMPVFIVHNVTHGNYAYCTLNEGLGKVLRYGAFSDEVINRLRWMEKVLAPGLKKAIELSGGIDLKTIIAQALHMGDELHNRNKAGTSLFIRNIAPYLVKAGLPDSELVDILNFINSNDHFFLNLSMPAAKVMLDAAHNIPKSTLVTTMARNGTEFGIRVSGLGNRWFTGPAQMIKGLLFPGFKEEDCNPDIGDSAITETAGFGGFAMAAAIAIVQFVGGTPEDALNYSRKMYEITIAENRVFQIPIFGFRGTPTGIDIRKVLSKNILPQINTGIAHREAGIGQVGAGLVNPPWECFEKALLAWKEQYLGE
ncbi:hypothetical protein ciss_16280 [Carboxydothermus islandicus]|uniref:DUF1116 domain-containing protein n=1 Tax=Carboxydothermus islandicus TaxID=661089 RepID=A0A1L8D3C8_9THEO|nr:DUF1116 domain-containing protein [Carboxydothermus islandicus]GAV25695.1 hypothetical protein ciss_16280 [Carboxydothermus islandicus]